MRKFHHIFWIILLLSCTNNEKHFFPEIQGDWISDSSYYEKDGVFPADKQRLFLSFEDTLCTYLKPLGVFESFKIEKDLLIITEIRELSPIKGRKYTWRIIKLRNDTLQIATATKETRDQIKLFNIKDSITFIKTKPKNSITPERISFFTSTCYGTCPSFFIEIDSSKNVKYFGHDYVKYKGGYKGTISRKDYESLLNKVHYLNFQSIDSNYSASWTDDQNCLIVIDYENESLQSSVYGYDEEPIELRALFHKIFEINSRLLLQKDSSIDFSSFTHNPVFLKFYPPPLPLPEKAKFLEPVLKKKN